MDALFQGNLVQSSRIIYTPSIFAKTNLLYLQETGKLQALKPHTSSRSHLSSYLFFLVLNGSGTINYQESCCTLFPGDCVFIDCKKAYSHCSSQELWSLQWVHFYGSNMGGIYKKYAERGGRSIFHPINFSAFSALLEELYQTANSADYIRDMRINEILTRLLTLLMEESWHPDNRVRISAKRQNLQQIKAYLEDHYQEKITLEHLSEQFFINKFYLTRIFKEEFGISINNYLTQIRITHAKQELRFTDKTIEQIGFSCGIEDANYFSRIFKKVEGTTPGEYRKKW